MKNDNIPRIRFKGFTDAWEQRKVENIFKITRGYVLPTTQTTEEKIGENKYPVYSSQTQNKGLMGYYSRYLYEDAITRTTDGANAGTVNFRVGKFYCTNVCGVLLPNLMKPNQMIAEALNKVSKGYVSYVGNPKLMNNVMASIEIMLPNNKDEQLDIAELFCKLDSLITLHQRKLDRLQTLKKGLLEKMFPSEGSVVPKIRFKGFTDAWEQRKFTEVIYQSGEKNVDDLPYESYSVSNTLGFVNQKEQFKYGGLVSIADKSKSIIVTPHTFAYNPARIDIGSIGYQNLDKNVIISPMYEIFKSYSNVANDRFLWHWFKSDIFNKIVTSSQEGGVRTCFNLPKLFESSIIMPKDIEEQKLIGAYIDKVDSLITLHQRKLDRLQTLKKGLLEKMFPSEGSVVPKIRFKGFTDAWEQRKLGDIGKTFTGLSGKTSADFGHGEGKFLPYLNIFNNPIADINYLESIEIDGSQNTIQYGDIFFTTSSETPEEVGMSSIWLGNSDNIYLNSFCFGFRLSINFNPYYFGYLLRSSSFRKPVTILAQGISRFNISKNKVMDIVIPLPSINEQINVGKVFFNLDSLITLHQRKLEKLKNIKLSLLEKMFV